MKICTKCGETKAVSQFSKRTTGSYQSYCKSCASEYNRKYKQANRERATAREAQRRAKLLNATPQYACLETITAIYKECPKGYHVDHIIPLAKGGQHLEHNLCYLPKLINIAKSDRELHEVDYTSHMIKPHFVDGVFAFYVDLSGNRVNPKRPS